LCSMPAWRRARRRPLAAACGGDLWCRDTSALASPGWVAPRLRRARWGRSDAGSVAVGGRAHGSCYPMRCPFSAAGSTCRPTAREGSGCPRRPRWTPTLDGGVIVASFGQDRPRSLTSKQWSANRTNGLRFADGRPANPRAAAGYDLCLAERSGQFACASGCVRTAQVDRLVPHEPPTRTGASSSPVCRRPA
jgi:hypothetical protein